MEARLDPNCWCGKVTKCRRSRRAVAIEDQAQIHLVFSHPLQAGEDFGQHSAIGQRRWLFVWIMEVLYIISVDNILVIEPIPFPLLSAAALTVWSIWYKTKQTGTVSIQHAARYVYPMALRSLQAIRAYDSRRWDWHRNSTFCFSFFRYSCASWCWKIMFVGQKAEPYSMCRFACRS